ncbi:MAG: S8 family serine peptidase [Acetobacteraceae bacterium]|nr:S8 family serine peptidase [Acetobacteraceae bacterium]
MAALSFRCAAALLLVLALVAGAALAAGAPQQQVLVGFQTRPDPGLISSLGGRVDHVYGLVPAVAARLPSSALEALRALPQVAYVEPDGLVWAAGEVLPWGIDRVDAELVHARGNRGDNVKLCIIDTGIDMAHSDLAVLGGYDFVNEDSNPNDDNGHGTHVAGTCAALDNGIGVVGVHNILLAAASGGSGGGPAQDTVGYPARYDSVIAVGAIDQNLQRYSPSSTGPSLELCAPGVSIYSTWLNNAYKTLSGTSMACPHVSGAAALVWSAHPTYTNGQVRRNLDSTAIDLGPAGRDWEYGYGMVYCPAAVR